MTQRVWLWIRRAARWYAVGLGAAVASLGNAELAVALAEPVDLNAYARRGLADLEVWLTTFAVPD